MKITSKKIFVFFVFCLIIHFFTTNTYAKTDVITGSVKEAITIDSKNMITSSIGISGIKLNIMDNNGNQKVAETNSKGEYQFTLEDADSYTVQLTVPNVTESEINNIKNKNTFDSIQNRLKYNPQDYFVGSNLSANSISLSQVDVANVFLVLDVSGSMARN